MPSSNITVDTGNIQSLTVSNLTATNIATTKITASNATAQKLTVAQAFVLTPQLVNAAGSNQSGANPITAPSVVVFADASTKGVRLPAAAPGVTELIANAAAFNVKVYPASADRIGAHATNASIVLPAGKGGIFFAQDSTTWRVILGA